MRGNKARVKNADMRHPPSTVVMNRRKSASPVHNVLISNNLARFGIMDSPPNSKISPGIPSGPRDFTLPVVDNHFLVMLILM